MSKERSLVVNPFDLLTAQQKILVTTYLETGDKTKARKAAGLQYSGMDPFRAVNVRRALNHAMRPAFDKAGITFEKHFEYVCSIAYGDPKEISETVKVNCRHCHGVNHEYQWTEQEYKKELNKQIKDFKFARDIKDARITQDRLEDEGFIPPALDGGFGFNPWAEPHESCPECGGQGEDKIYVHPDAASHPLFAGASYDKQGNIVIKYRDQDGMLKHVSELMGFLVHKVEVSRVDHATTIDKARKRAIANIANKAISKAFESAEDDDE